MHSIKKKTILYKKQPQLGIKYDDGKLRFDLILPEFDEAVAKVLTFGAAKYAPNSWQHVDDRRNRYYASLMRHLNAYRKGEKLDSESGLSHLAHAACNVMFLMYAENEEVAKDE